MTTCFADKKKPTDDYPEALKLVLAVQALVARGANLPDCILVPIGEGEDGKSFFPIVWAVPSGGVAIQTSAPVTYRLKIK